ncbi:MAG TPA: class I SAM-dependent methyltransferase [Jatrophihabitans sp.]|jgi:SAM-dependent methyltransferase|uniref:class I SAM-dependent methyltransferase n=1 Tax=Jatrophihabitans sp. TaxID=1932789 RepID=UPI002E084EF6|nr:class I SAM-dependent methyltransferase [Jatrophihabitans sp.]
MTRARHSYDRVAERYAAEVGDELAGKPLDRALLQAFVELAGNGPLADLGCGPGHVTRHLAGLGRPAVGTDLSPGMCAVARRDNALPFLAGDLTALPLRSGALAGVVCLYTVIHLDAEQRAAAYREFVRVLRPGGPALVAFHTGDADNPMGTARTLTEWWGEDIELAFHFLDPDAEAAALATAGFEPVARLEREPNCGAEHPSRRAYLLVRAPH